MTATANGSNDTGKVTVQIERTDDGLRVELQGLTALKDLKDLAEGLCCCVPFGCAPPRTGGKTEAAVS